jgi:recombination protein RecA
VLSLFSVTAWHLLSAFGLTYIEGGRAAVVAYSMPAWAALFSALYLKERLGRPQLAALALGMAGVAVLTGSDLAAGSPLGPLLMTGAAISWAAGIILLKRRSWSIGIVPHTGWQLIIGGVPIVLAWLALEPDPDLSRLTWRGVLGAGYAATVALIFCFTAYNKIVTMLPATVAALSTLAIPVVGLVSSALLLGEPLGARELVGPPPGRGLDRAGAATAAGGGGRTRLAGDGPAAYHACPRTAGREPADRLSIGNHFYNTAFRYSGRTPICTSPARGRPSQPSETADMADTQVSRRDGQRPAAGAGRGDRADRAHVRQGLGHAARPRRRAVRDRVVSTGSLGLDIAPGRRAACPRGRIIEIYGPESSGKTTLTLHVIAEAQKVGGTCAFIDAEHALDPSYAKKLGVDIDALLISQPDTGEQALEIADTLVRSGAVDVIVVDSVAALVPKAELEGEMGDTHVGLQARLMSQALRKLTASISRSKCMLIFTNQIRSKIGVMFGSPETTTGGNALKFYASIRLDVRRIGQVKDKDEVVGNQTKVKVVKNKVAPPFRVVEFDIVYGEGISKSGEIIDLGLKAGVVEKSGSWFSWNGQRIGQGRENAKTYMREHPEAAAEIERTIRAQAVPGGGSAGIDLLEQDMTVDE